MGLIADTELIKTNGSGEKERWKVMPVVFIRFKILLRINSLFCISNLYYYWTNTQVFNRMYILCLGFRLAHSTFDTKTPFWS